MLYRIWSLLKEAYHYEKHLIMFANTALIVMGLLWLVHLPLLSRILAVADFADRHRRRGETDAPPPRVCRTCVRPTVRGSHVRDAH